jgi:nucleotide-binding universal stress UspA family protein
MDYVSPLDERLAVATPLAERPAGLAGHRIVLLDISKNRGDEFLDRMQTLLERHGATVTRERKPLFSRPAPDEVIERVAIHGDLCVEGLAD